MSDQISITTSIYTGYAADVEGFDLLAELALDLRSSWNHATDSLWSQLDPVLWDLTHNPWVVQTVARDGLEGKLKDSAYRAQVEDLLKARRLAADAPRCRPIDPWVITPLEYCRISPACQLRWKRRKFFGSDN